MRILSLTSLFLAVALCAGASAGSSEKRMFSYRGVVFDQNGEKWSAVSGVVSARSPRGALAAALTLVMGKGHGMPQWQFPGGGYLENDLLYQPEEDGDYLHIPHAMRVSDH